MGNYIRRYAGEPESTDRMPSAAMWASCPWDGIQAGAVDGLTFWDDFSGTVDPTSADGYTITQVTSGAISISDAADGLLLVSSAASASADDGANVQMTGERWIPAAYKDLWFETRVKFSDVATTPDQFLIGLAETDTTLIASGALDEANTSMIAFYTDVNSTAGSLEFITNKAASVEIDTAIATVANTTFYKLGFRVLTVKGALQIRVYIDGVEQVADRVTDTDDIPIVEMTLSMVAQIEQTTNNADMYVDWVRIAQLS